MRTIPARIIIAVLLLVPLLGASRPVIHDPPPIWFEMKLEEGRLACSLRVMAPLVDQWLKLDRPEPREISAEDRVAIAAKLKLFFAEHPMFKADGIVVDPVIGDMEIVESEYHEFKIYYLKVAMEYPLLARPKTMSFTWTDWNIFETWPITAMNSLLAWDDEEIAILLSDLEPEYLWHAPAKRTIERVLPPLDPRAPTTYRLPVLSLAFAAGLFLFLPLSFVLRLERRLRWGVTLGLVLCGAATAGVAKREIAPPWERGPEAISREQAITIFESLHRNTYNAFRFDDESTIYDTLARSVDGALLERLYTEVYDGLIMREDGGVVCRVTNVEIIGEEFDLPDDPAKREFAVDATWLVRGRVGHFGHEHVRLLKYRAHFVLRELAQGWRIVDVQVRDQERLPPDDPEAGR